MAKLSTAIIVAIFIVVLLGVNSEAKARNKRETVEIVGGSDLLGWLCQNGQWASYLGSWCNAVTTTTTPVMPTAKSTSPSAGGSASSTGGSTSSASTSSSSPSPLQNALWCQLSNGTLLTNGQTYMQSPCLFCQCKQSRAVVCTQLTCMPTYCIDGTTPTVKSGNCCPTCAYETQAASCTSGASVFPHGTLITTLANNTQCWCEQGNIECRRALASATVTTTTTTWDYFSSGTTVYIIVIVICLVLVLGAILCCGCTLLYYYYYQNQQQAIQQAYEQYYNNAGWQPMGEEGQFGDAVDEAKKAEAEQGQFENHYPTGHTPEFVPPPYAVFNGPYGGAENKDQRQV